MKTILLALAATTALGSVAYAQGPLRTRVYAYPPGLSADEIRDYRMDQIERRQEMDREALRFNQKAERRAIDPDEDDID